MYPRPFDPARADYTASVDHEVASVEVGAWPTHEDATFVVKLNGVKDEDREVPLEAGETSVITIGVISADRSARATYTVNVYRDLPNDTRLGKLELLDGTAADALTPGFSTAWHPGKKQPHMLRYGVVIESDAAVERSLNVAPHHEGTHIVSIVSEGATGLTWTGPGRAGEEVNLTNVGFPADQITRLRIKVQAQTGDTHTHEVYVHVRPTTRTGNEVAVKIFDDTGSGEGAVLYARWYDTGTCEKGYWPSVHYLGGTEELPDEGWVSNPNASRMQDWVDGDTVAGITGSRASGPRVEVWCGQQPFWANGNLQHSDSRLVAEWPEP